MNKLTKTIGAVASALGIVTATAVVANAYTVTHETKAIYRCIGSDLWKGHWDYIDYSAAEEWWYPWPKDGYRYHATSLYIHNSSQCSGYSYA